MKKTAWLVGLGLLALLGVSAGAAADTSGCVAAREEQPLALQSSTVALTGDKWEEGIAYHKSKKGCSGCAQLEKEWPVIVDGCGDERCELAKESAVKQFKAACKKKGLSKCNCDDCILARATCNHGPGCKTTTP